MKKLFTSPMVITQYFGENPGHYAQYDLNGHDGLDVKPENEADRRVYSVRAGEVIAMYESASYGLTVKIYNKYSESYIRYGHLSQIFLRVGEAVPLGALIGIMGDTGVTTGPHVHVHVVPAKPITYEKKHPHNGYKGRMDILPYLEMNELI